MPTAMEDIQSRLKARTQSGSALSDIQSRIAKRRAEIGSPVSLMGAATSPGQGIGPSTHRRLTPEADTEADVMRRHDEIFGPGSWAIQKETGQVTERPSGMLGGTTRAEEEEIFAKTLPEAAKIHSELPPGLQYEVERFARQATGKFLKPNEDVEALIAPKAFVVGAVEAVKGVLGGAELFFAESGLLSGIQSVGQVLERIGYEVPKEWSEDVEAARNGPLWDFDSVSANRWMAEAGTQIAVVGTALTGSVVAGPAGGYGMMAGMEANGFMEQATMIGLDPKIAASYAKRYGAISGAIEYIQYLSRIKGIKGRASAATKAFDKFLGSKVAGALGITASMLGEGVEEWSQNTLQNILMKIAVKEHNAITGNKQLVAPEWGEGGMEAFAIGAAMGGMFKSIGALRHMGKMLNRRSLAKHYSDNIANAKEADLDNPKSGTAITVGDERLLILDVTKDGVVRVQGGVLGKIVREMDPAAWDNFKNTIRDQGLVATPAEIEAETAIPEAEKPAEATGAAGILIQEAKQEAESPIAELSRDEIELELGAIEAEHAEIEGSDGKVIQRASIPTLANIRRRAKLEAELAKRPEPSEAPVSPEAVEPTVTTPEPVEAEPEVVVPQEQVSTEPVAEAEAPVEAVSEPTPAERTRGRIDDADIAALPKAWKDVLDQVDKEGDFPFIAAEYGTGTLAGVELNNKPVTDLSEVSDSDLQALKDNSLQHANSLSQGRRDVDSLARLLDRLYNLRLIRAEQERRVLGEAVPRPQAPAAAVGTTGGAEVVEEKPVTQFTVADLDYDKNPQASDNSDRLNATMVGRGPKAGDTFTWIGDREATITKVQTAKNTLNKHGDQEDLFNVDLAAARLQLPGTKGGAARTIKGLTLSDIVRQGYKLKSAAKPKPLGKPKRKAKPETQAERRAKPKGKEVIPEKIVPIGEKTELEPKTPAEVNEELRERNKLEPDTTLSGVVGQNQRSGTVRSITGPKFGKEIAKDTNAAITKNLKALLEVVPEFAIDPTFTVDADGLLVFRDGFKFTFVPDVFGIDPESVSEGETIRIPLEDFEIKPERFVKKAETIAKKGFPQRRPAKPGKPRFASHADIALAAADAAVEAHENGPGAKITGDNFEMSAVVKGDPFSGPLQLDAPTGGRPVGVKDIREGMAEDFAVKIGKGHIRGRSTLLGFYKRRERVVRTKFYGKIGVIAHEVGHHLDRTTDVLKGLGPELKNELKSLDYQPEKRRTNEGFSEFFRHFMVDGDAQDVAPKFYKYFTETFLPGSSKELQNAVTANRKRVIQWQTQGAEARFDAQIDFSERRWRGLGPLKAGRAIWDWFQREFVQKFDAIRQAENEISEGRELPPSKSPFALAKRTGGIAAAQVREAALHGTFDLNTGERLGPGLRETLAVLPPGKKEFRQAMRYALAQHAVDVWAQGKDPGFELVDAQHILQKFANRDDYREVAAGLTNWHTWLVDTLVQQGGFPAEVADHMRQMYPNFVSLMRSEHLGGPTGSGGKRFANLGSPVKRLGGKGGGPVLDPIVTALIYGERFLSIANKVRVGNALVEIAEAGEGKGHIVEAVPGTLQATKVSAEDVIKQLESIGIEIDQENDVAVRDATLTFFSQMALPSEKNNVVVIWKDGKRKTYQLSERLADAMAGMDQFQLGPVLSWVLGKPAELRRLGATGLKPGFALMTNPFRDWFTAAMQTEAQTPLVPVVAAKSIYHALGDLFGFSNVAPYFRRAGGELTQPLGLDRKSLKEAASEAKAHGWGQKAVRAAVHPLGSLRNLFSVTEAGTRLAEFEATLKKGGWKPGDKAIDADLFLEAMENAAVVSVDFLQSGRTGQKMNRVTSFFNAQVQGVVLLARNMKNHPVRTTIRGMVNITLPTLLLWWHNKDEEWYKDLPGWRKNFFWNFRAFGMTWSLPKPFEYGVLFGSIPEAIANDLYADDPNAIRESVEAAIDAVIPPIFPTAIEGPLEIARNRSYFTGTPIVSRRLQNLPPEEQFLPQTTETSKLIGDALGVAPVAVDHLLRSFTGGLGLDVTKALETGGRKALGRKAKPGRPKGRADLPVIGRLFIREGSTRVFDDFYTEREALSQESAASKKRGRIMSPKRKKRLRILNRVARVLSGQRKSLREIDAKDVPDEEKLAERRVIVEDMIRRTKLTRKEN